MPLNSSLISLLLVLQQCTPPMYSTHWKNKSSGQWVQSYRALEVRAPKRTASALWTQRASYEKEMNRSTTNIDEDFEVRTCSARCAHMVPKARSLHLSRRSPQLSRCHLSSCEACRSGSQVIHARVTEVCHHQELARLPYGVGFVLIVVLHKLDEVVMKTRRRLGMG